MSDEAKRFKELNRFSENAKNEFNTIISALFKNAFTTHFEKALKENRPPEKKEIETFSIEAVETAEDKALFDFTQRVLLLSLLLGNEHADRRVQLADDDFGIGASFGVPSKDALEYLKSQIPVTKEEYAELERKLQFRAFTVSKLAEADFVNKAKASLIEGIEHSKSFSEIWDEFKRIGSDAGVDISAGYFETVYRTNIQSAYNAGRLMRYKNNAPPAWELLFMEDGNMSEICTALMNEVGGKAIKSDDPFWSTVGFPPYHYNCRTTFRAVYDYELNEGEIAIAAPKESAPLDNGFGGNPLEKESWWKLTDTMKERAKEYGLKDGIEAMAKKLGVKDFTISPASKAPKVKLAKKETKPKVAAASPEKVKGKPDVFTKETEKDKIISEVRQQLINNKIKFVDVYKAHDNRLEDEIIKNLGGGDETKGSCASVGFAYVGNKAGYDVRDFRGGASRAFFSRFSNIEKIANLDNVKSWLVSDYSDFVAVKKILGNVQEGKEYYLVTGSHAAIIRKKDGFFEFLELQDATKNGFERVIETRQYNTYRERFGCTRSRTIKYIGKVQQKSLLIDIETLGQNEEFIKLLGYINTGINEQIKGIDGYAK